MTELARHPESPTDAKKRVAELFQKEASYVFASLLRLGIARSDAEDLVNEVFMVVFRRIADYDPARPVRPWLFGIAMRIAMRYRDLAHHRREVRGADVSHVPGVRDSERELLQEEQRNILMSALAELDLDQRAVFVLHEIDEVAIPEVAAALEIPLNTAYSRLRLAREHLKKILSRREVKNA